MTEEKKWAKCVCGEEMVPGGSCKLNIGITTAGEMVNRVPFGEETRYGEQEEEGAICHDCNVRLGGIHHMNCDWEECPICHLQALGCECVPEIAKQD